jgi:hypothetical protein
MTLTAEMLPKFHTRQLLIALRKCCVSDAGIQNVFERDYDGDPEYAKTWGFERDKSKIYAKEIVPPRALGYDDYCGSTITVADLKAELAKRPHVPNKQESKALRQAKAQAGKNKGRKDR